MEVKPFGLSDVTGLSPLIARAPEKLICGDQLVLASLAEQAEDQRANIPFNPIAGVWHGIAGFQTAEN